jgi:hypothetical protein
MQGMQRSTSADRHAFAVKDDLTLRVPAQDHVVCQRRQPVLLPEPSARHPIPALEFVNDRGGVCSCSGEITNRSATYRNSSARQNVFRSLHSKSSRDLFERLVTSAVGLQCCH